MPEYLEQSRQRLEIAFTELHEEAQK